MWRMIKHFLNTKTQRHEGAIAGGKYREASIATVYHPKRYSALKKSAYPYQARKSGCWTACFLQRNHHYVLHLDSSRVNGFELTSIGETYIENTLRYA